MGIYISKLFVKSGAFNTLRIQSVAHALNNAYLHAHDSLVYCYSQHLSSSKEREIISKKQESSKAFYLNQRPLPQEFMHQRHHLLYPPCFSLEGCNRYRIIKCGYFQYTKQVYDALDYIYYNLTLGSSYVFLKDCNVRNSLVQALIHVHLSLKLLMHLENTYSLHQRHNSDLKMKLSRYGWQTNVFSYGKCIYIYINYNPWNDFTWILLWMHV